MSAFGMMRGAWRYRDFITTSIKREFVSRYLGTQLGFVWAIAQPLALILIYTVVFAEIMKPQLPGHDSRFAYSIYLTAGLITWNLFGDVLGRLVGMFVHNANLLKKVSVPKVTLPVIATGSALLQSAIVLGLFLGFLLLAGSFPGWSIIAILPILLIVVAFAVGLGILLGTVNVFYRDVEQSTGLILQFWFWLTPIVYPSRALPELIQSILIWNPLWPLVHAMQEICLSRRPPTWSSLIYPASVAITLLLLGWVAFKRLSDELVDEL